MSSMRFNDQLFSMLSSNKESCLGWVNEEFEPFHRGGYYCPPCEVDDSGGCSSEEEKYDSDNQSYRHARQSTARLLQHETMDITNMSNLENQHWQPQRPPTQPSRRQVQTTRNPRKFKNLDCGDQQTPNTVFQQPTRPPIFSNLQKSYEVNDGVFVRGDIAISEHGLAMQNNPKAFDVSFEDLVIGDIIGRGASSQVVRAIHKPSQTELALKVIGIQDEEKRVQLIQEIRSLYNTECVSIVAFHGAFFRQGAISIALEYMDGGSLSNVVTHVGVIQEAALANIAFQALWGLAYLHNESRIHRDIKPSNILINSAGQVKLTDFGVAKDLNNSIKMCNTFVGTFKYMSPERVQNIPYNFATDIWALGIVLLECATGKYPFDIGPEATTIALAQTLLEDAPPTLPPNSPNAAFSPQMRNFISLCVPKSPNDRYNAALLLGHPWLAMHGATNVESAASNVKSWIDSLQR